MGRWSRSESPLVGTDGKSYRVVGAVSRRTGKRLFGGDVLGGFCGVFSGFDWHYGRGEYVGRSRAIRRSIPLGTMSAVGLSLVVYLAGAVSVDASATVDELTGNYTMMIDRAFWGPAVLAGLLAASFSSALASFVGRLAFSGR